jgi:hypothetical protein
VAIRVSLTKKAATLDDTAETQHAKYSIYQNSFIELFKRLEMKKV